MEGMTNEQLSKYEKNLLKLVIEKLENSKDLTEGISKIKALLNEK